MEEKKRTYTSYLSPALAGALAGLSVDVTLYPLDTLKTRLQSQQGFYKTGGFSGVYRGFLTILTTSTPTTALFFVSYESTKNICQPLVTPQFAPIVHMFAASVGEVLACLIRVPTEIAKQRKQIHTGPEKKSGIRILVNAFQTEGLQKGVYRGFLSTVIRDLPFSFIELPLWESLKTMVKERNNGHITSFQSALCGSVAGCAAAALTTPLDVAKTRIMLAEAGASPHQLQILPVMKDIYKRSGLKGLFAGVLPRSAAFLFGGFVFFGVYDDSKKLFDNYFDR